MRKSIIFLIMLFNWQFILAQSFAVSQFEVLRFMGYNENIPVFENDTKQLFKLIEGKNELSIDFLENGKLSFFGDKFVGPLEYNDGEMILIENFKLPLKFYLSDNKELFEGEINFEIEGITTDFENKIIYFGEENLDPNINQSFPIRFLDLSSKEIQELPFKGFNPVLIGNYLFFADYSNPVQFDLVYDIYRVKVGDWNNVESIFRDNYRNDWKITPDGNYLLAEIITNGYSPTPILYDIDAKRYEVINSKYSRRPAFYSYAKNAICFYDHDISSIGEEPDRFIYFPIPTSFPYTPDWAMEFGDSFINTYWIEEAPEDFLKTRSKSDLRLLRNAIFARRGWRFEDQSLTDFFNQFEWYNDLLKLISSNDNIQLTNSDKYRAKLILKIESEN